MYITKQRMKLAISGAKKSYKKSSRTAHKKKYCEKVFGVGQQNSCYLKREPKAC